MFGGFKKIIYTCQACGAQQRIPLRRIHFFERFHELDQGQAVLILCPSCGEGVQIPTDYTTHTGHSVTIDLENPLKNAVVHGS
jgi:RNase P subunit RPR2